jgi:hypothetical protein
MQFIPQEKQSVSVPYFEEVSKLEGWQGHGTHKSVKKLQAEVSECINRLGGIVSGFQQGSFLIDNHTRDGFQIHYSMQSPDGRYVPGRLDIAALPVRNRHNDNLKEKALCMALYMLRTALDGMWFMQQLSPGYAALMPWMLADKDKTVSQLWAESPVMNNLLPPGDAEFIEGEIDD